MTDSTQFLVIAPIGDPRNDGGAAFYPLEPRWIENTVMNVEIPDYISFLISSPIEIGDTLFFALGKLQSQITNISSGGVTAQDGIIANISTTQVGATNLSSRYNFVDTASVIGASVMLLPATPGTIQTVQNNGSHLIYAYPYLGRTDLIYGLSANYPYIIYPGTSTTFVCSTSGIFRYL